MNMNSEIYNASISYTGDEILKWCKFQINRDGEYGPEAKEILDVIRGIIAGKIGVPQNEVPFHKEVFYFVCMGGIPDIQGYPAIISDIWFESDHVKSPDAKVKFI